MARHALAIALAVIATATHAQAPKAKAPKAKAPVAAATGSTAAAATAPTAADATAPSDAAATTPTAAAATAPTAASPGANDVPLDAYSRPLELTIDANARHVFVDWPAVPGAAGYRIELRAASADAKAPPLVALRETLNEALIELPAGLPPESSFTLAVRADVAPELAPPGAASPFTRKLKIRNVESAPPRFIELPAVPLAAYVSNRVRFLQRPGRSYSLRIAAKRMDPLERLWNEACRRPRAERRAQVAVCEIGPLPPGQYELELREGASARLRQPFTVEPDAARDHRYPRDGGAWFIVGPEFGRSRQSHRFLAPSDPTRTGQGVGFSAKLGFLVPVYRHVGFELGLRIRSGEGFIRPAVATDPTTNPRFDPSLDSSSSNPVQAQWQAGPRFKFPWWNSNHSFAVKMLFRDDFTELLRDFDVAQGAGAYRLRTHSMVLGVEHSYRLRDTRYEMRSELLTAVPFNSVNDPSFGTGRVKPLPSFELWSRVRVHAGPTARVSFGGELLLQKVSSSETNGAATTITRIRISPKFGVEWDF